MPVAHAGFGFGHEPLGFVSVPGGLGGLHRDREQIRRPCPGGEPVQRVRRLQATVEFWKDLI